jgi:aspartate dehydrogenase
MKIALIGNGAIAKLVTKFCATREELKIVGAIGLPENDKTSVGAHPLVYDYDQLLGFKPDFIVECASHSAVDSYAARTLDLGLDILVVSTGSLADEKRWNSVKAAADRAMKDKGTRLLLPPGALPGIDCIAAAKLAGLTRVSLRSAKPPKSWSGTPAEEKFDLDKITAATAIFTGNAREAALMFPKNANIAATAALAGIGFEKTEVTLVADPAVTQNVHRLEAEGTFGEVRMEVKANPSPDNPKTSHMAALSIMRVLANRASAIVI